MIQLLIIVRRLKPGPRLQRPTYTKYYPARPGLVNYFRIPDSYKPGSSSLLPLLIDVHGDGLAIGHPTIDDPDNAKFSHRDIICVVSINYRKAPHAPFPIPVEDVAALIEAVLDDPELPIDKSKVAIAGYSARGHLALATQQLNGLYQRIKGAVAIYPAVDLSRTLKTRIGMATSPTTRADVLIASSPIADWAYILAERNLQNPTLSPIFMPRDTLPEKLYLIGCEYDLLCAEARDMATRMADLESHAGTVTKLELLNGRTGRHWGNVTWEELKGMEHGFNTRYPLEKNKKLQTGWQEKTNGMHATIAEWLFREVYN
jgi:acetyl esterase/lipase